MRVKIMLNNGDGHVIDMDDETTQLDLVGALRTGTAEDSTMHLTDREGVTHVYPGRSIMWASVHP